MKRALLAVVMVFLCAPVLTAEDNLAKAVADDYDAYFADLFVHFHSHPELSFREYETAARLAEELRQAGVEVTEGVGGTGVVGMLRNGDGPLVLVRADIDGLPIKEDSGLAYASEPRLSENSATTRSMRRNAREWGPKTSPFSS